MNRTTLAGWSLDIDAAYAIALDNMRHKAAPNLRPVIPGTYVSNYGDCYDSARILLPELARQLELNGEPVAMVPTRECLVITGERDDVGQALMLAIAEQALERGSRPLTAEIFRLQGTQWSVWQPGGARVSQHRKVVTTLMSGQYQAQRDALNRALAANGEDVFVAAYNGLQRPDGTAFSYAALTTGVDTLLPEVDYVVVVALPSEPSNVQPASWSLPWDAFKKELGTHLQPTRHVLPRYRICFRPNADQIARLSLLTVPMREF